MLGSISPVGEASRAQRWWLTATAYTLASVAAGAAIGTALGVTGQALAAVAPASASERVRLALLGAAMVAAAMADAGTFGWTLPGWHRQVDERWLATYRGWVYGAGFGAQLGVGVATIVTSTVTYTAFAAALLSASWRGGLAVGAAFGVARSIPLLLMAPVRSAARLHTVTRGVAEAQPLVHRLTVAGQGVLAATALLAAALGHTQ
jgi:sulfite exporter TauE/SafE